MGCYYNFMKTVCEIGQCAGCMACKDVCPRNAITIDEELEQYNAYINSDKCINCGKCTKVCQQRTAVNLTEPLFWYQGWSESHEIRSRSTSGGVAQSIEIDFIENGGNVVSCYYKDGEFIFGIASSLSDVSKFAGSKYVKSNPSGAYNKILDMLKRGCKVLFVGLPCQAASLRNYIPVDYCDNLYIVDLLCHGSPSPVFLEKYIEQFGKTLKDAKNIRFRRGTHYEISINDKNVELVAGVCDHYSTAFLEGICLTRNCYSCKYAQTKRVGDLSIGDYWGSGNAEEAPKGISLVLVQNRKGEELIENSKLHIETADKETAIFHNQPLRNPISEPVGRGRFLDAVKNEKNINKVVNREFAWIRFKQFVKGLLIKNNIIKIKSE